MLLVNPMFKNIINNFLKLKFKFLSKTIYKNNFKTSEFYKYFFSLKEKKFIVQVGGNDGIQNDPLNDYFKTKNNYSSIIFEPINYYYQILSSLYKDRDDVIIKNNFISNDLLRKKIFYVNPELINELVKIDKNYRWVNGLGSLNRESVEEAIENGPLNKDIKSQLKNNIINEISIPIALRNIEFNKKSKNLVVIDVQGFELDVILSLNFNQKVDYIVYEDEKPFSDNSKKIRNILTNNGYVPIGRLTWNDQIYFKNFNLL